MTFVNWPPSPRSGKERLTVSAASARRAVFWSMRVVTALPSSRADRKSRGSMRNWANRSSPASYSTAARARSVTLIRPSRSLAYPFR